ncbi:MAG TPA: sulfotransferase, partial [Rhodospirillales bacterium]|nr:sulfotransferase [Rhodospirillales bacterium]
DFRYQKTMGPHEPNEWGWFWKHWLRLGKGQYYCTEPERIDGAGLCRKLAAMESVKQAPLFFDNVYAKANLDTLRGIIPNILVLRLRRDPYYVCNSHLNARLKCYGNLRRRQGHPPRGMAEIERLEDPVEQIVVQIKRVIEEIEESLAKLPAGHIHTVDYLDIVADPKGETERFAGFLESHGARVERRRSALPERLENKNDQAVFVPEYKDRLDRYFDKHFGSAAVSRVAM